MTTPFGPKDEELDRIYAGLAPNEQLEEVATFMLEVKAACSDAPTEDVAQRHVAAMVAEARRVQPSRPLTQKTVVPAERNRWRRVMDRTISTVLKGAAGVLAASMSMMGLAYAGVDLPGTAAERAIEAVTRVELPNQGEDGKSVAEDVESVIENSDAEGCEFGHEVAAAASQNAEGDGPGSEEDPCTEGDDAQGSKATGEEKSAEGRAKAAEKSGGASDQGSDNAGTAGDAATDGAESSTSGSDRASDGADNAGTGRSTADDNTAGAGSETDDTEDDGADGRGTAEEKSGGASGSGASNRP